MKRFIQVLIAASMLWIAKLSHNLNRIDRDVIAKRKIECKRKRLPLTFNCNVKNMFSTTRKLRKKHLDLNQRLGRPPIPTKWIDL